ncbi:MAG: saccharopine dehydrogenase NADP-binding domain-containing protein, partial [Planctomycetota bacterium]|nr:saccharopine dehydrogenase NADP-binding domain-containing protein [Planctomycetota bacterium]
MKILVIGCGLQGFEIARDILKDKNIQLGVADIDTKRLQRCRQVGVSSIHHLDIADRSRLYEIVKRYDVIIGAVPGRFGFNLVKNVIELGRDMVDISFMPENILKLDRLAKKHLVRIIPDCGLAPGLSNILVGHALSKLKKVKEINIYVGGLPQIPRPPLNYRTVFSLEDVLEVYTRKVKIIKDGHIKEIAPLSGLEKIEFAG